MELKDLAKELPIGDKNSEAAVMINSLYNDVLQYSLKQQRDWYINERFVRWEHWIVYNKTLNRIQNIPTAEWEVRRTINKIRTQTRGVKNFIKRSQPRWTVRPESSSQKPWYKIIQKVVNKTNS